MPKAVETDDSWTGMGHLHRKHHWLCAWYLLLLGLHAQGKQGGFHAPKCSSDLKQTADQLCTYFVPNSTKHNSTSLSVSVVLILKSIYEGLQKVSS